MTNYFSLHEAIKNSTSNEIIDALKTTTPENAEGVRILFSGDNAFTYDITFLYDSNNSVSTLKYSFTVSEKGAISKQELINVDTISMKHNNVQAYLPLTINPGDKIDIEVTYLQDPLSSVNPKVLLIGDEHDAVISKRISDYSPDTIDGLKCWLVPDRGITLNYQSGGGNIDATKDSTTLTSSATSGMVFTIDDVGKHIKLIDTDLFEYKRIITAFTSATEVSVNEAMPLTETDMTMDIGYIAQWDDVSGNGVSFIQATASKQPTLIEDVQNGLPSVYFAGDVAVQNMLANKHIAYERTVYAIVKSTETATTASYRMFFGDVSGAGTWFGEWANPTPLGLYLLNTSQKGNQAILTGYGAITDVRTTFHIVAIRLSSLNSNLRVDETSLGSSSNDIGSVSPTTLLSLGSRGDGAYACLGYMSELIIYDRYHTDEEVLIIEKYLKDKYNL